MKPRRNPRKKPAIPPRSKLARASKPATPTLRAEQVVSMRDLFWQNVLREMLTSLSTLSQQQAAKSDANSTEVSSPDGTTAAPDTNPGTELAKPDLVLFDGRLAIITKGGERIAIASITPMFGCGAVAPSARELSLAIECTIFQINTPDGHVFTLPVQEIRAFHALTPEIMARLEQAARRRAARREVDDDAPPFGFAAFTSLARGQLPLEPPPAHPME